MIAAVTLFKKIFSHSSSSIKSLSSAKILSRQRAMPRCSLFSKLASKVQNAYSICARHAWTILRLLARWPLWTLGRPLWNIAFTKLGYLLQTRIWVRSIWPSIITNSRMMRSRSKHLSCLNKKKYSHSRDYLIRKSPSELHCQWHSLTNGGPKDHLMMQLIALIRSRKSLVSSTIVSRRTLSLLTMQVAILSTQNHLRRHSNANLKW